MPTVHTPEEDLNYFRNHVLPKNKVYVAGSSHGQLVGFIAFDSEHVHHLYLSPEVLRQGIGARLLNIAKSHSAKLQLWTFQKNDLARRFYTSQGFMTVEETDGSSNEEQEPDMLLEWCGLGDRPLNPNQELADLSIHLEQASSQLRDILDVPVLERLKQCAKESELQHKMESSQPYSFNAEYSAIFKAADNPDFARVERVATAAGEGFKLDRDDLFATLELIALTTETFAEPPNHRAELPSHLADLQAQLIKVVPSTYDELLAEHFTTQDAVSPAIHLQAKILEISQPLSCYEEAAQISQKAISLLEESDT